MRRISKIFALFAEILERLWKKSQIALMGSNFIWRFVYYVKDKAGSLLMELYLLYCISAKKRSNESNRNWIVCFWQNRGGRGDLVPYE